ncbi:MAG: septal ring lytic transglycosylase RlpA family protein [Alphaproteobacteria bacterium]|nr:septal ring lytic transglycosylase RlpA family protein [Alphaproteobacteria bacterium]
MTRLLPLIAILILAGCSEFQFLSHAAKEMSSDEVSGPVSATRDTPNGTHYKVGRPYEINGVWYYPRVDYDYQEEGIASWYGPNFHGRPTANGAIFDMNRVSAAHRTLPLPSMVRVTNLENGRSLKVKVNDRGPFAHNRIIDLSRRGAQLLGFERQGTALVRVEIVEGESRQLAAAFQGEGVVAASNVAGSGEEAGAAPRAAPTVSVSGTDLAPPPGVRSAAEPAATPKAEEVQVAARPETSASLPESDTVATVTPGLAGTPVIYVQAGAFSQFTNARRAQALLSPIGDVSVEQIMSSSVPLFRIRVGPASSAIAANSLLIRVQNAGYPDARIVVVN